MSPLETFTRYKAGERPDARAIAKASRMGFVYFVQGVDGGPIKIGFTNGPPEERMRGLQVGSPVRLRLIGWFAGCVYDEGDWHRMFRHARLHGEWFSPVPDLMNLIASRSTAA